MPGHELDTLCRALQAAYTTAPVTRERLTAWRSAVGGLDVVALVAVLDDAVRTWPERMPTFGQIRAAVQARIGGKAYHPPPADATWPDELRQWREEHRERPWCELSALWERYPRGTEMPEEVADRERQLRTAVGIV